MLKKFLDIKNIIIIILTILVVWMIVFRKSNDSNELSVYKVQKLEEENHSLEEKNEELIRLVNEMTVDIIEISNNTLQKERQLNNIDNKLKELLKRKDEIRDNIDTLDNVGVANAFTDYIQRRSQINN